MNKDMLYFKSRYGQTNKTTAEIWNDTFNYKNNKDMNDLYNIIEYRVETEYRKYKNNPELTEIMSKKLYSDMLNILDKYNTFLLKNGYTDTDIIAEEPTALDQFLFGIK